MGFENSTADPCLYSRRVGDSVCIVGVYVDDIVLAHSGGGTLEWFVKGFEQAPEDERYIQASACCKHYAANSMEHTTEGGQTHTRHDFSANITQQDLVSPLWPEPNVLSSMNH